ncbi:MAG: hypothetical protein A2V67_19425 [Deltaproteobacteria bacterium RBG_13_61_14]|nr:MAG: hypothetical protein A2V67_19425 [Deltaproteobacteria bacterium RBG_13_61_14]
MTTYAEMLARIVKSPLHLVKLHLDQCQNEYGQAPCTATGGKCYYTYGTCKDKANYSQGTAVYKFTTREAPLVLGAAPYLKGFLDNPAEIRDEESTTRREKVTLKFHETKYHPIAVPEKTTSPVETAGTFWRNLLARQRYYPGRKIEVYQGFEGLAEAEFQLIYKGRLTNWKNRPDQAELESKDLTSALDKEIPDEISSDNVLVQAYSNSSFMFVTDASEFPASGCVSLPPEDPDAEGAEDEWVRYTARNLLNNTLTGCVSGSYGTPKSSHPAGTEPKVIEVFAKSNDWETGLLGAECYHLLLWKGGLDMTDVAYKDLSLTLNGAISDHAATITLTGDLTKLWDEGGCIRIGTELIKYTAVSGQTLTGCVHGAYGTTAAAHGDTDPVYGMEADFEFNRWLPGCLFKRYYDSGKRVVEMLQEFRESTGLRVWQGEDCMIHCKLMAPPLYDDPPAEWNETLHLKENSQSFDAGEDKRCTRGRIYYRPLVPDPSDNDDYSKLTRIYVDYESSNAYGEAKLVELTAPWCYDSFTASLVLIRFLIRFLTGAGTLPCRVGYQDSGVGLGDFVKVTTSQVVDEEGQPRDSVLFETLKKQKKDESFEYVLIATQLDEKYGVWGPADLPDFDEATQAQQEKHCWWGNASNLINGADGYHIY